MVKLAMIGAGNIAKEHLKAISQVRGVCVTGIFSRTEERTRELSQNFNIPIVASSVRDLFEKTNADGVIVAVSETSLEEVSQEVSRLPWKVLIEKPIGINLNSYKFISRMFATSPDNSFVAMNRRNYDTIRTVAEIGRSNKNRNLVYIIDQEDPKLALERGREKIVCENWHYANSVHMVDLFLTVCRGEPNRVENVIPWETGFHSKVTHSIIHFDSGDIGVYHSIWNSPGPWSLVLQTDDVRLELRPLEKLYRQIKNSRNIELMLEETESEGIKPGFKQQIIEFVNAIQSNKCNLLSLRDYEKSVQLTSELYS